MSGAMVVVPVVLGCCPDSPRCLLCPPPRTVPPAKVEALIHHYREERSRPGSTLMVRFYGGAAPTDAQLEPLAGRPFGVRVRPDLLTRAEARRLIDAGCVSVELDALTFDNDLLRRAGRHYGRRILTEQSKELPGLGVEVGGVLAPGLPRSTHATALADAHEAAGLWSFARIHPVLVLADSALRDRHASGRYPPLEIGEAVTICREMLDVLEPAGVIIRRVGLQPGPDGIGRAVAGPRHSSLRELVESRRTLDRLRELFTAEQVRGAVVVRCAPADETRTRGPLNQHIRTLRAEFSLTELTVRPDPALDRGHRRVESP